MPKSTFQRKPKRKFCQFCAEKQDYIDYKDVNLLLVVACVLVVQAFNQPSPAPEGAVETGR